MWPLLALAGAAMDNSLVYGKIFNFTPALWKFRTIMRNFANFWLWFLFLIAIFKTLFTGWAVSDLFGAMKKLVLWAILVQVSRFVMATLIDLSTVATVGIGWIPLYAVKDDSDYKKIRFLKPYGIFQLDQTANQLATKAEHTVFYGCANDSASAGQYYIPCKVDNGRLAAKKVIMYDDPESWESRRDQFIASWSKIPVVKWLAPVWEDVFLDINTINDNFCVYGNSLISNPDPGGTLLTQDSLVGLRKLGVEHMEWQEDNMCLSLDNLIQWSKGMSGPLFTLYASLLNTSELALSTNHKTVADLSLEFLMRTVMAILLFIPLLVFAIIMIMRVAYLWLIIAASPILVLLFINKKEGSAPSALKDVIDLKNILSLIFLPVIATFAISMSVVFLSLIQRANFMRPVTLWELFDLQTTSTDSTDAKNESITRKCYDLKVTRLCFNESQKNAGNNIGDTFSYLLINGFWLALMWTVVFAALKSSKITEGVVDSVKKLWESALWAIPIIPTGSGMVSYTGAGKYMDGIKSIPQQITNQQNQGLQDELSKITNMGAINDNDKKLATIASPTTNQSEAKTQFLASSAQQWTNHTDYDNFFSALNKGGGSTINHTTLKSAFADEKNYASYGMDGMQTTLKNRNGSMEPAEQKKYLDKYGQEMRWALDDLSTKPASWVKKVESNGKTFYIDTAKNKYSLKDPSDQNNVFTVQDFPAPKTTSPWFDSRSKLEEFIWLTASIPLPKMKEKELFKELINELWAKAWTADPTLEIAWVKVHVDGTAGNVTTINIIK